VFYFFFSLERLVPQITLNKVLFLGGPNLFFISWSFMNSKMVRIRGGGSSNSDRVRPTASVRRRCGGPITLVPNEDFEDYIEQEVEIYDEGYPRGPVDKSLLINYEDRVARQLWDGLVSNEH